MNPLENRPVAQEFELDPEVSALLLERARTVADQLAAEAAEKGKAFSISDTDLQGAVTRAMRMAARGGHPFTAAELQGDTDLDGTLMQSLKTQIDMSTPAGMKVFDSNGVMLGTAETKADAARLTEEQRNA